MNMSMSMSMSRNPAASALPLPHGYAETDPSSRYGRFEEVLGKGAMKTVYKAIDEVLGIEVAWNQVNLNQALRSPDDLQRLYSEVHLLSTLSHDSVIRFYTSWIDVEQRNFNFITEMFSSGTLREYRKKYNRVDIRAIKNWARQILEGLVYLHSHDPPVIHRDLKCDNIFVNGHLGQVKIGDLGLAAILQGSKSAHSVIGTPEFMAPELYEEDYNELVDVYSFGMCVLEMLTAEYPYSECCNPAQIYKKVTSGKLPGAFYRIQDVEAQKFIGRCLVNASERVSAKQLLLDPFLASDPVKLWPGAKPGGQKPFLNEKEMEKLQLTDDSTRTQMTITGKLNPENDTIFLKVQITDKDGATRNVYFPFDILNDTPLDVAVEMVKELEMLDWGPIEIAEMIDGEISALVPDWKVKYQEDMVDDSSSWSSSQSGTYSTMSYFSGDEYKPDMSPQSRAKYVGATARAPCSTRFCNQYHALVETHVGSSSRQRRPAVDQRKLTRNRSLVDVRSQLLHRSLVEEVSKRRLSKTVGAVENIGFQSPCDVGSQRSSRQTAP